MHAISHQDNDVTLSLWKTLLCNAKSMRVKNKSCPRMSVKMFYLWTP